MLKGREIFVVSGFVSLFGGCMVGYRNRLNFNSMEHTHANAYLNLKLIDVENYLGNR